MLVIALFIFGPKRLPELGKSVGRGFKEFKGSISPVTEMKEELREIASPTPVPAASPATTGTQQPQD